jgi:hypothetical protein
MKENQGVVKTTPSTNEIEILRNVVIKPLSGYATIGNPVFDGKISSKLLKVYPDTNQIMSL